jgi:hypothetical protein
MFKSSYRRSLQPSIENIQHFKKRKFINFALIFALLGPDLDCESGSVYGSRDPIESGSTALLESLVFAFGLYLS